MEMKVQRLEVQLKTMVEFKQKFKDMMDEKGEKVSWTTQDLPNKGKSLDKVSDHGRISPGG